MFRIISSLSLALVMVLGSGCASIVGNWESSQLSPDMAREEFRLLQSESSSGQFMRAKMTFDGEGTYNAEVQYEGGSVLSQGEWEWENGKLELEDDKFGSISYPAALSSNGKQLTLSERIRGTTVELTLDRK
ncbi:MAG: hypothetical protein ACYTHJ_05925 [Planctomycetota bacterium]|jgi:hypothetical protein